MTSLWHVKRALGSQMLQLMFVDSYRMSVHATSGGKPLRPRSELPVGSPLDLHRRRTYLPSCCLLERFLRVSCLLSLPCLFSPLLSSQVAILFSLLCDPLLPVGPWGLQPPLVCLTGNARGCALAKVRRPLGSVFDLSDTIAGGFPSVSGMSPKTVK